MENHPSLYIILSSNWNKLQSTYVYDIIREKFSNLCLNQKLYIWSKKNYFEYLKEYTLTNPNKKVILNLEVKPSASI